VAKDANIEIDNIVQGLRSISDDEFTCDNVYQFLADNPVDVDSIIKFFYWDPSFYTRNLIYKDARFELMAICWERGQVSRVHDHSDQKCWMTVPIGKLRGRNFAVSEIDESRNYCKLIETETFELSDCRAAKVELEQPIHEVQNLAECDARAVSIHIYSKPFDRCLSYCRETHTYKEVPLFYTSIGGKLCRDVAAPAL
jgi:cysteine dioxygenase